MSTSTHHERFPPGDHTPAQQSAFADAERTVNSVFGSNFQLKDADGNLLGPFGIMSYTSEVFTPYLKHMYTINSTSALSARERELATLATCSVTQAQFVIYAHKIIARSTGLSEEQVDAVVEGRCPETLEGREKTVCEVALLMARGYGKMSDGEFEGLSGVIGKDGVSALAQVVGSTLMNGVLVNMANVRVPAS